MIRVGDILAYTAERLDFSMQAAYSSRGSIDAFYRHLNNALKTLAMEWPVFSESSVLATTTSSGILYLPDILNKKVIRIESVDFPSTWGKLEFITPQEMNEYRQKVLNESLTGPPRYWTFHSTGSPYLEFQPGAEIDEDSLTVKYSYILKYDGVGYNYGKDDYIPLPLEYEHYLSILVAKYMCPKEDMALYQRLNVELQDERTRIYDFRTISQHREVNHRPIMRF